MTETSSSAFAQMIAGDTEDALRAAIASLKSDPLDLASASLVAELVGDNGEHDDVVAAAREVLVTRFVNRGDLPSATVVALEGGGAGGLLSAIAGAFGKGSSRVAEVSSAPPPLPQRRTLTPELLGASGDALFDLGAATLTQVTAEPDTVDEGQVPALPLFEKLEPEALEALLGAFEVRYVAAGEELIEQGDEGREAFVLVRGTLEVHRSYKGQAEDEVLALLGPGALFGEMALVSEAPRAAGVRAKDTACVLAIERESLESLAEKAPVIGAQLGAFCRERMLANLMRSSAILGAVEDEERAELIGRFETRTFDIDEALVEEGDDAESLFLIASGGVTVRGKDSDGDDIQIASLGPGDVVGEIGLVLRRPATADVIASHPTVALALTREAFQEAIRQHPTLLSELYDIAVKRDEETRSVVAQEALDASDIVLI